MNSEWPIQTHRRPFCTPKPDADLCMRVDLRWPKKLWKISTGLAGLRAAGPSRAVDRGPLGRWAAGPWRAVGRVPLGRGPAFSKTRLRFGGQRSTFVDKQHVEIGPQKSSVLFTQKCY